MRPHDVTRPLHPVKLRRQSGDEIATVKAERIGQWAVHPKLDGPRGWYTITYVREGHPLDGMTIGRVEDARLDRFTAVGLAEALDRALGTEPLDLEKHKPLLTPEIDRVCGPEAM